MPSTPPGFPPRGYPTAPRSPDSKTPWTPGSNDRQIAVWASGDPDDSADVNSDAGEFDGDQVANEETARELPAAGSTVREGASDAFATDERNSRDFGTWAGYSDSETDGTVAEAPAPQHPSDEEAVAPNHAVDLSPTGETIVERFFPDLPPIGQLNAGTGGVSIAEAAERAAVATAPTNGQSRNRSFSVMTQSPPNNDLYDPHNTPAMTRQSSRRTTDAADGHSGNASYSVTTEFPPTNAPRTQNGDSRNGQGPEITQSSPNDTPQSPDDTPAAPDARYPQIAQTSFMDVLSPPENRPTRPLSSFFNGPRPSVVPGPVFLPVTAWHPPNDFPQSPDNTPTATNGSYSVIAQNPSNDVPNPPDNTPVAPIREVIYGARPRIVSGTASAPPATTNGSYSVITQNPSNGVSSPPDNTTVAPILQVFYQSSARVVLGSASAPPTTRPPVPSSQPSSQPGSSQGRDRRPSI